MVQNREDLIDMIDKRVSIGITAYDLNYQQKRHAENQFSIQRLDRKLSWYTGALAVLIPLAGFLLHKIFG